MSVTNISARTAQPNTPETDAMPVVDHVVNFTHDGKEQTRTVLATDPMDAIDTVRRMFGSNHG